MADEPVMPADVAGLVARLRAMSPDDRTRACVAVNICVNNDLAKRLFTVLHDAPKAATALEALSAENERLRKALKEAADALDAAMEDVEHWGAYAGEYFQDKHDLDGDLSRISEQATAARCALEGGE